MSAARDEILGRVRAAKPGATPPAQIPRDYTRTDRRGKQELTTLFCERVDDYRAEVERVGSDQITAAVAAAAARHGARRLIVPPLLPDEWRPDGLELTADRTSFTPHQLDDFDGVITGCTVAIAETGTIMLTSGPHEGRRALSLIPDLHICIVDHDQITGSVPEAIEALGDAVNRDRRPVTLISGPSATSDIELQRVEGVHGPRKLVVLVVS